MTQTAIVILNYNGRELLRKFLPSVFRYSQGASIIVADNNSSDGSVEMVAAEFPEAGVIRIPDNLGFCGGYNFALAQIKADYFVLLNSDVEVTPNWLAPVIALFENDATIGAAQPKILSYQEQHKFEYAGAAGGFLDALGFPFCRGRIFQHIETDEGQYNDTRPVFWATGACLFIRSALYQKIGGLDEDYFAHMEEIDLCWKLNRSGFQVYCHGESKVYHVGGGTLNASNPRKTYLNFRNGLSLILKHLPTNQLIWKFPLRIGLDWVAALKFLLEGSPLDSVAVMKAHGHLVGGLRKELRKRGLLKKQLIGFKVNHLYKGLIVFDFYFLKRKVFSKFRIQ